MVIGHWSAATLALLLLLGGCRQAPAWRAPALPGRDPLAPIRSPRTAAERIVNGAREEVRRGVLYDASYVRLAYPGGDVPPDRGACTDVVVRALRHAGYDLQRLIHEDMRVNFRLYPRRYGLTRPDRSIDHRRTPNHVVFFTRHGRKLPTSTTGADAATWQPGDLVYWRLDNGMGHCGVLADVRNAQGLPLVIHNIGSARQEDCLTAWQITHHFRFPRSHRGG